MSIPAILRRLFLLLGRTLAAFIWGRQWRERLTEVRSTWNEARALRRARKELEAQNRRDRSRE